MTAWGSAVARARGLSSRLLPSSALASLQHAREPAVLRRALATRGYALAAPGGAAESEEAMRLGVAAELHALDRWLADDQRRALQPLFMDEDRRSVRRVLRGLLAGRPPAARLGGTLATPTLPLGRLEDLALRPSVASAAALLAVWKSPFAAIAEEAARPEPRLLALELALDRAVGERMAAARLAGGPAVVRLARSWSDGLNACTAVLLAGGEREILPESCFLAGGRRVPRDLFLAAASAAAPAEAARRLAPRLPGALGDALRRDILGRGRLEAALAADLLAEQRRLARVLPLSPAPVAVFVLALLAEARTLRRAAWRLAVGLAEEAA